MRSYPLEKTRADGWFKQLGEGSQGFAQLCEVVGDRFVAFSVIAGIRITALTVDPRAVDQSVVEFEIGDLPGAQRLALGDFRERLAHAMLSDDDAEVALPASPDSEALQAYIGFRYVLLAPLFGIRLEELLVEGGETDVTVTIEESALTLSLQTLRELVRERVREELAKHRAPSPFAIDLNAVPRARVAAAAEDHKEVADILGGWPAPLSVLLRTAEGQNLAPEVRATLAEALAILGTAYVQLGRAEWAQEVLRLGVQWAQENLDVSADLFRRLGDAYIAEGRYGEAIGLLRRAVALGAPRSRALPLLAQCFSRRGRHLAALAAANEALAAGADPAAVSEVRGRAIAALGDAWERFAARVTV